LILRHIPTVSLPGRIGASVRPFRMP
jgi:hypothetical protein